MSDEFFNRVKNKVESEKNKFINTALINFLKDLFKRKTFLVIVSIILILITLQVFFNAVISLIVLIIKSHFFAVTLKIFTPLFVGILFILKYILFPVLTFVSLIGTVCYSETGEVLITLAFTILSGLIGAYIWMW